MHGKCSCNCSDARREGEDDRGGEAAASCRCVSSHTAATLWSKKKEEEEYPLGYVYKVKPCRCRSWFCDNEDCLKVTARQLLNRLLPVLETFDGMMMLTLTVDPKLFASPLAAYEYLKEHRCVAELVRSLWKAGHLRSRRFFYVVEWQRETEMPHFHLLVDADFIPFGSLAEAWNRFRPDSAGPVVGNAPGFGHVRISKKGFANSSHAARYACKYLTKPPRDGYPSWVMEYRGQIKRFSTSRGLLSAGEPKRPVQQNRVDHPRDCLCKDCCERRSRRSSVAERVRRCCEKTILVRLLETVSDMGEVVLGRPAFVARADMRFAEVVQLLEEHGRSPTGAITLQNWDDLLRILANLEDKNEQAVIRSGRDLRPRALPDFDAAETFGPWIPRISEAAA